MSVQTRVRLLLMYSIPFKFTGKIHKGRSSEGDDGCQRGPPQRGRVASGCRKWRFLIMSQLSPRRGVRAFGHLRKGQISEAIKSRRFKRSAIRQQHLFVSSTAVYSRIVRVSVAFIAQDKVSERLAASCFRKPLLVPTLIDRLTVVFHPPLCTAPRLALQREREKRALCVAG